jgi:prophage regulatory protein
MTQNIKLLNISEVAQKLSAGKSTIYDWMSPKSKRYKSDFPKPLQNMGGVNRWLESEIDAWILGKRNPSQNPVL